MMHPVYIPEHDIYDIFYNDVNQYVIVRPILKNNERQFQLKIEDSPLKDFSTIICPHEHTYIHCCKHKEYFDKITLIIDGIEKVVSVNKYPSFQDEIIMSTLQKNEFNYIYQWILFHISLGVRRFIIYDNGSVENMEHLLKEMIENKTVVLIQWDYPYHLKAQMTQQNHSIYAFRRSKYIGLLDIDEYVNMQSKTYNLSQLFDEYLKSYGKKYYEISAIQLNSKMFYNQNNEMSEKNFDFLEIPYCGDVIYGCREKCFVNPLNVSTFSVHTVTSGKPMLNIGGEHIYFNHYIFLNKPFRGRKVAEDEEKQDLTILPKYYHMKKVFHIP